MSSVMMESSSSCVTDPDFAVVLEFLGRFGVHVLGDAWRLRIRALEESLLSSSEVSPYLKELLIKLLRRLRKSLSAEKWEKVLLRFLGPASEEGRALADAMPEGFAALHTRIKIQILRILCEEQFEHNAKFRSVLSSEKDKSALRSRPLGQDELGNQYWFFTDEEGALRIFKEDLDEETWDLVAKDKESFQKLIERLRNKEDRGAKEPSPSTEEASEELDNIIRDTGPAPNSIEHSNATSVANSDEDSLTPPQGPASPSEEHKKKGSLPVIQEQEEEQDKTARTVPSFKLKIPSSCPVRTQKEDVAMKIKKEEALKEEDVETDAKTVKMEVEPTPTPHPTLKKRKEPPLNQPEISMEVDNGSSSPICHKMSPLTHLEKKGKLKGSMSHEVVKPLRKETVLNKPLPSPRDDIMKECIEKASPISGFRSLPKSILKEEPTREKKPPSTKSVLTTQIPPVKNPKPPPSSSMRPDKPSQQEKPPKDNVEREETVLVKKKEDQSKNTTKENLSEPRVDQKLKPDSSVPKESFDASSSKKEPKAKEQGKPTDETSGRPLEAAPINTQKSLVSKISSDDILPKQKDSSEPSKSDSIDHNSLKDNSKSLEDDKKTNILPSVASNDNSSSSVEKHVKESSSIIPSDTNPTERTKEVDANEPKNAKLPSIDKPVEVESKSINPSSFASKVEKTGEGNAKIKSVSSTLSSVKKPTQGNAKVKSISSTLSSVEKPTEGNAKFTSISSISSSVKKPTQWNAKVKSISSTLSSVEKPTEGNAKFTSISSISSSVEKPTEGNAKATPIYSILSSVEKSTEGNAKVTYVSSTLSSVEKPTERNAKVKSVSSTLTRVEKPIEGNTKVRSVSSTLSSVEKSTEGNTKVTSISSISSSAEKPTEGKAKVTSISSISSSVEKPVERVFKGESVPSLSAAEKTVQRSSNEKSLSTSASSVERNPSIVSNEKEGYANKLLQTKNQLESDTKSSSGEQPVGGKSKDKSISLSSSPSVEKHDEEELKDTSNPSSSSPPVEKHVADDSKGKTIPLASSYSVEKSLESSTLNVLKSVEGNSKSESSSASDIKTVEDDSKGKSIVSSLPSVEPPFEDKLVRESVLSSSSKFEGKGKSDSISSSSNVEEREIERKSEPTISPASSKGKSQDDESLSFSKTVSSERKSIPTSSLPPSLASSEMSPLNSKTKGHVPHHPEETKKVSEDKSKVEHKEPTPSYTVGQNQRSSIPEGPSVKPVGSKSSSFDIVSVLGKGPSPDQKDSLNLSNCVNPPEGGETPSKPLKKRCLSPSVEPPPKKAKESSPLLLVGEAMEEAPVIIRGEGQGALLDAKNSNGKLNGKEEESVPLRQSRRSSGRIASLRIKETERRQREEEEALLEFQKKKKRKKKAGAKEESEEVVSMDVRNDGRRQNLQQRNSTTTNNNIIRKKRIKKDSDYEAEEAEVDTNNKLKKRRRRKKKKRGEHSLKEFEKYSSGSDSDEEVEEEDYAVHEEDEVFREVEDDLFKSDHEFSCESDVPEDEAAPIKHARTLKRKKKGASRVILEEPEEEEFACTKCGKGDHPEWILLCDTSGCEEGWHASCLRPSLMVIPEGAWHCPPCQHKALLERLQERMGPYEVLLKKKEADNKRKERLAFVSLSLSKVIPASRPKRKKSSSGGSSSSGESSSSSSSDEESPIQRRRAARNVNYNMKEYDDMIKSALRDEETISVRGAPPAAIAAGKEPRSNYDEEDDDEDQEETSEDDHPHVGKGKDMSNILAEESKEKKPVPIKMEINKDLQTQGGSSKKKKKKFGDLAASSEEDGDSGSDYRLSASNDEGPSESEEEDEYDYGGGRGKKKSKGGGSPTRRSSRNRKVLYDDDFIFDGSLSEDEEQKSKKVSKKKKEWDSESWSESDSDYGRPKKSKARKSQPVGRRKRKKHEDFSDEEDEEADDKSDFDSRAQKYRDKIINSSRRTRGKNISFREEAGGGGVTRRLSGSSSSSSGSSSGSEADPTAKDVEAQSSDEEELDEDKLVVDESKSDEEEEEVDEEDSNSK